MATNTHHLPYTWEEDLREPAFSFSVSLSPTIASIIPSSLLGLLSSSPPAEDASNYVAGATFDVYAPLPEYWILLVGFVILQAIFAAAVALVLHTFVVKPKAYNTTGSLLLGYAILIPMWIIEPPLIAQYLNVRQLLTRFAMSGIMPTLVVFRIMSTIHGYVTPLDSQSLRKYLVFFAMPSILETDKQGDYIEVSGRDIIKHITNFLKYTTVCGLYQSWLLSFPHQCVMGCSSAVGSTSPYLVGRGTQIAEIRETIMARSSLTTQEWYTNAVMDTFSYTTWINSFFVAISFMLYLATYCEGLILLSTVITRCKMKVVMKNPLFASGSPSEFWGRQWNLLVHSSLKNGVYKPVRSATSSALLATVSAFAASGLLHEWIVASVYDPLLMVDLLSSPSSTVKDTLNSFPVVYGGSMIFFAWQAGLVMLEHSVGSWKVFGLMSQRLPKIVKSLLVVLLGVPTAHMFLDPYMNSTFFHSSMVGFFTIVKRPLGP